MTEIVNQPMLQSASMNMPFNAERRLQQERIEAFHVAKQIVIERTAEKVLLDKLMLEAYYEKLDRLETYNRQAQLLKAQAEQGRILDIEV